MRDFRTLRVMESLPGRGRVPILLADADLGLLRTQDRVFEAMPDGWRAQLLAHGLTTAFIKSCDP